MAVVGGSNDSRRGDVEGCRRMMGGGEVKEDERVWRSVGRRMRDVEECRRMRVCGGV